jgi:hypothetical protein
MTEIKKLKEKVKRNNLIITRADKGNTMIIMGKTEYISKTEEFIEQGPYETVKYDYTNRYQAKIKKLMKENIMFSDYEKKQIMESNPSIPTLKCQIKLHKEGMPIRPIISFIGAPSYKLARTLSRILREKFEFKKVYSIKKSRELIQELDNVEIGNNTKLISIDVKDMFTNIPIDKVMELIKENRMNKFQYKDQMVEMIKTCMEQNYFRFNNKFYIQKKGLPMGSSLSPIMAEIYMNELENNVMNSSMYKNNIKKWVRYVDDILIIWEDENKQIDKFMEELNGIEMGIQFKEEIGGEKIAYLDLNIMITEGKKFEVDIYRKSTYSDAVIPYDSFHPVGYKMAGIYSMCYRAVKCLRNKRTMCKEIERIKEIVKNNNYKPSVVDKVIKKIYKRMDKGERNKEEIQEKYLGAITYVGWKTEKIRKCFKKYGINVATKKSKTVFEYIKNKGIEEIPTIKKSGIYRIKCEECEMVYIGETGRSVECRLKEHKREENNRTTSSLYARHFMEKKHKFIDPTEKYEVLGIENKLRVRKLKEELEILKLRKMNKNKLMNIKTYFDNEDIFYHVLKKYEAIG